MNSVPFRYQSQIPDQFPGLSGIAILCTELAETQSIEELTSIYRHEQEIVKDRMGNTPLSEIPSLAAWRSAFRKFGVDPTQYRCAAEALLRRLQKKGDIPSIHPIVDICNLISIRYALPVAAFDLRQVQGVVTVQFASGVEYFNPLGEDPAGAPLPGEVIFMDEAGLVLARRWCWRQSVECASGVSTRDMLVTIEAQDEGSTRVLDTAGAELIDLLQQFMGGKFVFERIR